MMAWYAELAAFDWAALDVREAGEWPRPAQWLALLALGLSTFLASWFFHVEGKRDALHASEAVATGLKATFRAKALEARDLPALREREAALADAFAALVATLPADTEVPGLVEDIAAAAVVNRLVVERVELREEHISEHYVELPISLTLIGDYHQLGTFTGAVANLPRLVTLHHFELAPLPSAATLRLTVLAKTYRYRTREAAA